MDATISDNIRELTKALSKVEKAVKERWKYIASSSIIFSSLEKLLGCVRWGQNCANFADMTLFDISKESDVDSDFIDECKDLESMLNRLIKHCERMMIQEEQGVDINWGESWQSAINFQTAPLKHLIQAFDLWEKEKEKVNRRVGLQDEPEGRLRALENVLGEQIQQEPDEEEPGESFRALENVLGEQIQQEPDEENLFGSRSISPVSVGQGSFEGKQGGC